ncbi:hypothetical protein [Alloscardovia omnicolens]|uniref:hypothetical protein n=1 Tax=Alloscardovia omnicolens TaxID=419015 RepID=UPI0012BBFE54|nr:hypothetical protein [Alloscardovia omnicolens]MDK6523050.1 hypothetical protein [Alloscardovia omnicolens]
MNSQLVSADGKAYNFVFQSAEKYVATTIPYGTYTLKYTIHDGYEKSPNKDIIASGSAVTIDDNADSGRLYVTLVRSDREPNPVVPPVQDNPSESAIASKVVVAVLWGKTLLLRSRLKVSALL